MLKKDVMFADQVMSVKVEMVYFVGIVEVINKIRVSVIPLFELLV